MARSSVSAISEEIELELIECIRQPGWLRITRYACVLRYLHAQKKRLKIANDEFSMARKSGLEICRTCPVGRALAERLEKKRSSLRPKGGHRTTTPREKGRKYDHPGRAAD